MIPKVIHYCWFGGNPKPASVLRCIASWERYCPDYEIREWNETNYDVTKNLYMRQAYEAKKWAFASDYARLDILWEQGGVYMDTDVELLRSLDELMDNECFMGFEKPEGITPSVAIGLGFGAVAHSPVIGRLLKSYDERSFLNPDGTFNTVAVPVYTTQVLTEMGLAAEDRDQRLPGVTVYASDVLCPMGYYSGKLHVGERTVSIHHYDASWVNEGQQRYRRERGRRIRLQALLGQKLGTRAANFINLALRRDGSFTKNVRYNLNALKKRFF